MINAAIEKWMNGPAAITLRALERGRHPSPAKLVFGIGGEPERFAIAYTDNGLAWLEPLGEKGSVAEVAARIAARWAPAELRHDDAGTLGRLLGDLNAMHLPLKVHLCGTAFQLGIWSELIRIKHGETVTYAQLAAAAGNPKSARAAGSAVAANHIAMLVPCHRVLPASSKVGQYRWGSPLKRSLLARERVPVSL